MKKISFRTKRQRILFCKGGVKSNMPKKIDGIRHYCLLLNESELEQAKQISVKRDIRTLTIVGNTSCFIRYLIQQFIALKKE